MNQVVKPRSTKEGLLIGTSFQKPRNQSPIRYVEKITTILTNPSFLLKFSTVRFRHVSAYYQVMFNTDEQFLFYNFIMILKGNKLTRLNKLT